MTALSACAAASVLSGRIAVPLHDPRHAAHLTRG